jgi:hypothetical protein
MANKPHTTRRRARALPRQEALSLHDGQHEPLGKEQHLAQGHHPPPLTVHSRKRSRQRGFRDQQIEYVRRHGRLLRRTGIRFYFLAEKDVPPADLRSSWVQRLVGATLLVDADGEAIITLYKNSKALRDIKKKRKYRTALQAA